MKKKITELKKLFKVVEVTVTRTDTIGQLKTNQKVNKNIVGDVKNETFQNQLIRDYLERQYLLEDSELDKIAEINSELNSQIDDSEIAENILWTPKEFEFSNMFSYGENNLVRFEKAQGIMGILLLMQVVNHLFLMHYHFVSMIKLLVPHLQRIFLTIVKITFIVSLTLKSME